MIFTCSPILLYNSGMTHTLEATRWLDDQCPLPALPLAEDLDLAQLKERRRLEKAVPLLGFYAEEQDHQFRMSCLNLELFLHPNTTNSQARKYWYKTSSSIEATIQSPCTHPNTVIESSILEAQLPLFNARRRDRNPSEKQKRFMQNQLGRIGGYVLKLQNQKYLSRGLDRVVPLLLQAREEVYPFMGTFRESGKARLSETQLDNAHHYYTIQDGLKAPMRFGSRGRQSPSHAIDVTFSLEGAARRGYIEAGLDPSDHSSLDNRWQILNWLVKETRGISLPDHAVTVLDTMSAETYYHFDPAA